MPFTQQPAQQLQLAGTQPPGQRETGHDLALALRLLQQVRALPGGTLREFSERMGISRRQIPLVVHALATRRLAYVARGSRDCHVLPHSPGIETCWMQVVVLRRFIPALLHGFILHHNPADATQITAYAQQCGVLSADVVRTALTQLEQASLLRQLPAVRRRLFQSLPPHLAAQGVLQGAKQASSHS